MSPPLFPHSFSLARGVLKLPLGQGLEPLHIPRQDPLHQRRQRRPERCQDVGNLVRNRDLDRAERGGLRAALLVKPDRAPVRDVDGRAQGAAGRPLHAPPVDLLELDGRQALREPAKLPGAAKLVGAQEPLGELVPGALAVVREHRD